MAPADDFNALFRATYLAFHRRDGPRSELSGASRAVLHHLSLTGPVTIGEAARHLDRAQSVVSDIVTQLERNGLVAREPDPDDRRRVLVWLTGSGRRRLQADGEVLSADLLDRALGMLSSDERIGLLAGMHALVQAGQQLRSSEDTTSISTPGSSSEVR